MSEHKEFKKQIKMFKYRVDISDIKDINQLKNILIENKNIHNKYKNIIKVMDMEQLKNFLYSEDYDHKEFEGVAPLFTAIIQKDFNKIVELIIGSKLETFNFLRLMFFCLEHDHLYENNKLGFYIKTFKIKFETQFKRLLFEVSEQYYIDKLDLVNLLRKLINK